jgi:hypothetical protein
MTFAALGIFYERQEAGAGEYFEQTIKKDILSLERLHGIHRLYSGYHRMNASVFPYAIYYRETQQHTEVVAVLDLRRKPSWLRAQLRNR